MTERVTIEDGIIVPVQTRIKNICKKRKEELRVSNQQISDGILEMFGIDVPIGTVANFFAERSKAASVYTTGYICAYLGVSLDEQFGIKTPHPVESATEIAVLQERIVSKDTEIRAKDELILEKDLHIFGLEGGIKNRRPVIRLCLASVVVMAIVLMFYVAMDFASPEVGFFQPDTGYPVIGYITIAIVSLLVISVIAAFIYAEVGKRKNLKK